MHSSHTTYLRMDGSGPSAQRRSSFYCFQQLAAAWFVSYQTPMGVFVFETVPQSTCNHRDLTSSSASFLADAPSYSTNTENTLPSR